MPRRSTRSRRRLAALSIAGLMVLGLGAPTSARSRPCGDRYRFVNQTEITWFEADAAARSLGRGAHLATVSNPWENACVEAVIPSFADAWIGGTDAGLEGEWRWIDVRGRSGVFFVGTADDPGNVRSAYTDWDQYYPQPDDWDGEGPDEDCLEIWGPHMAGGEQTWNDRNCDVRGSDRGFVVEFERSR